MQERLSSVIEPAGSQPEATRNALSELCSEEVRALILELQEGVARLLPEPAFQVERPPPPITTDADARSEPEIINLGEPDYVLEAMEVAEVSAVDIDSWPGQSTSPTVAVIKPSPSISADSVPNIESSPSDEAAESRRAQAELGEYLQKENWDSDVQPPRPACTPMPNSIEEPREERLSRSVHRRKRRQNPNRQPTVADYVRACLSPDREDEPSPPIMRVASIASPHRREERDLPQNQEEHRDVPNHMTMKRPQRDQSRAHAKEWSRDRLPVRLDLRVDPPPY